MKGVKAILERLRSAYDVQGVLLLDRHGRVVRSQMPPDVQLPAFAVWASSIFEAAQNMGEEFQKAPPRRIEIRMPEGDVILAAAGPNHLLAVILGTWDAPAFSGEVDRAADALHTVMHDVKGVVG
jgi:predicted regulator of Ras-like GTPase activity (Roadblock/LC7/MglB family)